MRLDKSIIDGTFPVDYEHRPWGYYGLYSDNTKCTAKILFIKHGEALSLQYHFQRDQLYILLNNDFTIEYSKTEVPDSLIYEPNEDQRIKGFGEFLDKNLVTEVGHDGDMFGFKRKVIHRTTYNGKEEFGRVLDLAFGTNNEGDIYRIKDNYGREDIKV